MEYMQMEPVITRQMVFNELVKAGINREIADDLSYRYYKNELTTKDLQYLESNFNFKLEILERGLRSDIEKVKDALDNKIDTVENNLNNKIDTKFNELDNKIDIVRKDIELNKMELDTKIDKFASEVKGTLKLHAWMFGTIITLTIGILLTLLFK
ncbi:BDR-repeat family protein (plasmid) [Borrelia crocidurae DOU]|uniref:BDR-repeat family protein n=1 Tax=Borrelia crocidurae DOU TaxID=1293575 RepID=W5SLR2_9SPIR|nr:Bdr family repetitive protein [Borrelia crocidurae]AHH07805.1 BDR-repeat family protein [Borrelia crocidurae DOU]